MSDSEASAPIDVPTDAVIEQTLQRIVREACATGDDVTVNSVRTRAETQLGLETGFWKTTGDWKQRSKDIITAAFQRSASPVAEVPKAAAKSKAKAVTAKAKRKSEDAQPVQKRRKKAPVTGSEEEDEPATSSLSENGSDEAPAKKREAPLQMRGKVKTKDSAPVPQSDQSSELSDVHSEKEEPPAIQAKGQNDNDEESDLSSVIDDPPPKKRQKKSVPSETKPRKKTTAKPKAKGEELSPDEKEIKVLQKRLVSCGVRKLWHRELAKCETTKDKIRHLKQMLVDQGMTGRFSEEKAKQIKLKNELAAELQDTQQYNEQWGRSESEDGGEEKGALRPRRAAPRGLVDFGDSGDSSG